MTNTDIRIALRTFTEKFVRTRQLGDDENIFAAGGVNSLFVMQLVLFIEKTFSLSVENADLEMANFESIDAMVAFVDGKRRLEPCDD